MGGYISYSRGKVPDPLPQEHVYTQMVAARVWRMLWLLGQAPIVDLLVTSLPAGAVY